MKRFLVSTFSLLTLAGSALAVQTVSVGRAAGTYLESDHAGEFRLTLHGDPTPGLIRERPFQSFCIEREVDVQSIPVMTYDVTISRRISSTERALTPEAAYLYYSFIRETLVNDYDYDLGPGRETSARVLQAAIWFVQGQGGSLLDLLNVDANWDQVDGNSSEYARANAFVAEAQNSGWTSMGDVRVLNLASLQGTGENEDGQDMLVLLVPAPGAVALGAVGLAMLGCLRRRSRF